MRENSKKNQIPSYQRVQDTIRKRIANGVWGPGDRIPPERELSQEFGLNRMTISKGLLNLASEGLLVRKTGQGTFVNDTLKPGNNQPCLIKYISSMPYFKDYNRLNILDGLYDSASSKGFHIGIDYYDSVPNLIDLLQSDKDSVHAGFVVWYEPDKGVDAEIQRLQKLNFPFVLADTFPPQIECPRVSTRNIEGSRMAVDHLVSKGHKNIVYITRPVDRKSLEDRLTGFINEMVVNNLPVTSDSVIKLHGKRESALSEVASAIDHILALEPAPTALLLTHEDVAIEFVKQLKERGVSVPGDISILSFDCHDASHCSPHLTTVLQDFFEMGKIAGKILLERLGGRPESKEMQIEISPKLIERDSVADYS